MSKASTRVSSAIALMPCASKKCPALLQGLLGICGLEGPSELVPGSRCPCNSRGLVAACSKRGVKHTQRALWRAKWGM